MIKQIVDHGQRRVTFEKRKIGLVKKAMELSILCDAEISMTIHRRDHEEDLSIFASDDFDETLKRYQLYSGPYRLLTNEHVTELSNGKPNGKDIGIPTNKRASNEGSASSSPATLSNLQTQLSSLRQRVVPQRMRLKPVTMARRQVIPPRFCSHQSTYQRAFDQLYLSLVGRRPSTQMNDALGNAVPAITREHGKRTFSEMSGEENDAILSNQPALKKIKTEKSDLCAVIKKEM